ncbi:MAG: transposase [Ignavibacteriae bacterium]|nr:transposase [Ignavibacteriota bacterium]
MKRKISEFTIHRRHLPHWELPGATYFVTFTLKDRSFFDLTIVDYATIILKTLAYYFNKRYFLYDHTVMPDHVHLIIQPIEHDGCVEPLGDILGDIKSYSAKKINGRLGRKGSLWLDESYDRIIRDEAEYLEKANYIFQNPVNAGLVDDGAKWKWWSPGYEPQ